MDLLQFEASHYCEKVRLALRVKGLSARLVNVRPGSPEHKRLKALTGHTTVPVLRMDDGRLVRDSTAIAVFLDDTFPKAPSLASREPLVRLFDDWADEVLGPTAYALHQDRVMADPTLRKRAFERAFGESLLGLTYPAVQGLFAERGRQRVGHGPDRLLRFAEVTTWLDAHLRGRRYLIGDTPTLADVAVVSMLLLVHRPPAAPAHPVVPPGFIVDTLSRDPATERLLDWHTRLCAELFGATS